MAADAPYGAIRPLPSSWGPWKGVCQPFRKGSPDASEKSVGRFRQCAASAKNQMHPRKTKKRTASRRGDSVHDGAAVHVDDLARDEARLGRHEEAHRVGEFLGLAEAPEGHLRQHLAALRFVEVVEGRRALDGP